MSTIYEALLRAEREQAEPITPGVHHERANCHSDDRGKKKCQNFPFVFFDDVEGYSDLKGGQGLVLHDDSFSVGTFPA
jgi:hypothetical protein